MQDSVRYSIKRKSNTTILNTTLRSPLGWGLGWGLGLRPGLGPGLGPAEVESTIKFNSNLGPMPSGRARARVCDTRVRTQRSLQPYALYP